MLIFEQGGLHATLVTIGGEAVPELLQGTSYLRMLTIGGVTGYAAAKAGLMPTLAPIIMSMFGWEMDAQSVWNPKRGFVIYHRKDGIIPYQASLHVSPTGQLTAA